MSTTTLPIRSSRRGLSRLEREVVGEIELAQAHGVVAAARESARIDAIASVAHRALLAADQISTVEAALVRRRPDERAELRLRYVADSAAAAIGDVVVGLDRRL